jgi:hypothetical protein
MSHVAPHRSDPRIALGIRGRRVEPLPVPGTGEKTRDYPREQAIRDAQADLPGRP